MNCNSCHKNPCCCEKIISVRGKKGPKGDKGIAGPQGVPGQNGLTNVFILSDLDNYVYIPDDIPVFEYTDTITITESGNYFITYEGCVSYVVNQSQIDYALFKNSAIVLNSDRTSREFWPVGPGELKPIVTVALNSGILALNAGDVIQIGFISESTFTLLKRSLTLIQVNNLTIL